MVVLHTDSPILRNAEFETAAHRSAPAGRISRTRQHCRVSEVHEFEAAVYNCGTALGIKQNVVPGVTKLAGEKSECVNIRSHLVREVRRVDRAAFKVSP